MASDHCWLLEDLLRESQAPLAFREFTAWTPWGSRSELRTRWGDPVDAYGGVYLLANKSVPTAGPADPLDPDVIYVGEGGWLRRRWRDFERSAFSTKSGHSGGHSYRRKVGTDSRSLLHIAALPLWFGDGEKCDDSLLEVYRLALERAIILRRHILGHARFLNKK